MGSTSFAASAAALRYERTALHFAAARFGRGERQAADGAPERREQAATRLITGNGLLPLPTDEGATDDRD
jgi:hypothetical protein